MHRGGSRPSAEFISGDKRKQPRKPQSGPPVETPQTGHIDLRIVRRTDTSVFPYEWHEYLDDLGSSNHHLGTARSLGSVAITYVPAKFMNTMLATKYPKDFHHHKRKLELFRKVNSNVRHFIREQAHYACDARISDLEIDREARRREFVDHEVDEIFAELGMPRPQAEEAHLTPDDQHKLSEYSFGPLTLSVRALDFYGKSRFGLDLSANPETYHERHEIVDHLRREGLPVQVLDSSWVPHATVFRVHDHINAAGLSSASAPPNELTFRAPVTESYGI